MAVACFKGEAGIVVHAISNPSKLMEKSEVKTTNKDAPDVVIGVAELPLMKIGGHRPV